MMVFWLHRIITTRCQKEIRDVLDPLYALYDFIGNIIEARRQAVLPDNLSKALVARCKVELRPKEPALRLDDTVQLGSFLQLFRQVSINHLVQNIKETEPICDLRRKLYD